MTARCKLTPRLPQHSEPSSPRSAQRRMSDPPTWDDTPSRVVAKLEKFIADNPLLAIGAGVCAGVTVGWLIKRR